MKHGFTLVEVIAILLVVVLGLFSVTGLFIYGLRLANRAQASSTAMATAMGIAVDDAPLLDPAVSVWSRTATYGMDDSSGSALASGYVNGYYVIRREEAPEADIITGAPGTPAGVGARSVHVDVDVYEAQGGEHLASYTTRFVRTRSTP